MDPYEQQNDRWGADPYEQQNAVYGGKKRLDLLSSIGGTAAIIQAGLSNAS